MIRTDIKNKLQNKNLDEIFLQHRDEVDQGSYRVAEIDGEVLVWNPNNGEIMDYFYDDSNQEFFNIKDVIKNLKFDYKINKKFEVFGPKGKFKTFQRKDGLYPSVHLKTNNSSFNCSIHRIIALIFIPKLNIDQTIVDHINRNRLDYSISNLRWVTPSENNLNASRKGFNGNNTYFAYKDKNLSELVFKLSEEDFYNKYGNKMIPSTKSRVKNAIFRSIRFDGYYWKIEDNRLIEYLGEDTIDSSLWVEHYSKKFYVHPLGIMKIKNKVALDHITIGSLKYDVGSYKIRQFYGHLVHRLVAEVFLNNNSPLATDQVVDHIDCNSLNNRVTNLKIGTQLDNMNNPNKSLNKLQKSIVIDNILYESYVDAARKLNINRSTIRYRVLSDKYPNYKFKN